MDHNIIFTILIILLLGVVMSYSASTAVAERIGLESAYFYKRHLYFAIISFAVMLFFSSLNLQQIKLLSIISLLITLALVFLVLFAEPQLKGAKRWLKIFGFSMQPSEFLKAFFIVINAWFLSRKFVRANYKGYLCSSILIMVILTGLILQPDFGMVLNFSAVWVAQIYLSMVSYIVIIIFFICAVGGIILAYYNLGHVKYRVDNFLFADDPTYQIRKSLDAIDSGGLFGQGLFEGTVKKFLPDAHTDFIFAALIEELGMICGLILVLLYFYIIIRIMINLKNIPDMFSKLVIIGIAYQLTFQVFVNIGVNLNILPAKGTTLPLISYGGSSMVASGILFGILLALSKESFGHYKLWQKQ